MTITVGIGEFAYSSNPTDVIKTYGLGSCVALVVHSHLFGSAGLIHVALPDSAVNPARAAVLPGYFADTGIPLVLDYVNSVSGGARNAFSFRMYGGSNIMDDSATFDIGRRNALAIKRLLWRHGCAILHEDLGGDVSRTVSVAVIDGEVDVRCGSSRGRTVGDLSAEG